MYDFKLVSWFKSSNNLQSVMQQIEGDISRKSICRHVCNCLYSFINVGNLLHWILKQQWRNAALVLALEQPYLTLHNLWEVFAFLTKNMYKRACGNMVAKWKSRKKLLDLASRGLCHLNEKGKKRLHWWLNVQHSKGSIGMNRNLKKYCICF